MEAGYTVDHDVEIPYSDMILCYNHRARKEVWFFGWKEKWGSPEEVTNSENLVAVFKVKPKS